MDPRDNAAIARVLGEIADLLELHAENPFKIRAYRTAADLVASSPEAVAALDAEALRAWPGIGRDLSQRIVEIAQTGSCALHRELAAAFPASLLDLLRLQGVGPKTAALLYRELRIASLDELEAAARAGRLRALKGMGARKEALLLRALEERKQHAHRHLLPDAADTAARLVQYLSAGAADVAFDVVGSVRCV